MRRTHTTSSCGRLIRIRAASNYRVRTLTVREWKELPIGENGVPATVAQRLHTLAEREARRLRVPQPILTRTARSTLQAGQVVGVLTVPGASVEILPKIGGEDDGAVRRSLTRMLAVALRLPVADSEPSLMATQRENLLEVLVQLFTDRLLVAARRGLPHRYLAQEEDLSVLRGKLDVRRQLLRNAASAYRLACVFDELSVNTPLNRVLKAAVRRLVSITHNAANYRRLIEAMARFEFVDDSPDPLRERVRLDRTNGAFHQLHRLARLFLAGDWQSTMAGRDQGFGLLFAMNDLFEQFVGRSLQAAMAPRSVRLQRQDRYALKGGERGLFCLQPDIVVDDDVVIDTKWKWLDPEKPTLGVAESDVYQMLAYARGYGARRVVLLYPWHEDLPQAGVCRNWLISGTSTALDVATVDVGRPGEVRSVLRSIVDGSARRTLC